MDHSIWGSILGLSYFGKLLDRHDVFYYELRR